MKVTTHVVSQQRSCSLLGSLGRKFDLRTDDRLRFDEQAMTGRSGSGSAVPEIRKLPFGEISWPMSGNDPITEIVG